MPICIKPSLSGGVSSLYVSAISATGKEAEGTCKTVWFYFSEVFLEQELQDTSQSSKAQKFARKGIQKEDVIEKDKIE